MYTKCIQNVYHISTSFCTQFVNKIKRTMPAKFCIQNVYKTLSKCGIHFVDKHFLYILYTSILIYKTSYRMYIQITVCGMDPIFQHIFGPFVVHFLVNHCK